MTLLNPIRNGKKKLEKTKVLSQPFSDISGFVLKNDALGTDLIFEKRVNEMGNAKAETF